MHSLMAFAKGVPGFARKGVAGCLFGRQRRRLAGDADEVFGENAAARFSAILAGSAQDG
jgi:hypothetical protein